MKIRLVLLWACAAFAVIALQGAGPVSLLAASTGSSGIQAPSTTSTNTDGSTGGFGDLGTSYNGTYNPPALTLGTTLTEYANTPSWGNQGSGNKHAVAATETLTSTVQNQQPGWVDPYPTDPVGHFWSKGFLKKPSTNPVSPCYGQSPDFNGGAPSNGPITVTYTNPPRTITYNFYTNAPYPQEAQKNNASDLSSSKNLRARSTVFTLNVTSPGELGVIATAGSVPTAANTTAPGVSAPMLAGNTFPVQIASTASLPGNAYSVILSSAKTWHVLEKFYNYYFHYQDTEGVWHSDYQYTVYCWTSYSSNPGLRYDYNTRKLLAGDASIDTRKGYGDAIKNDDTKQVGDPNADLTNYNFGTSVYHGGLFVGIMPWTTGDMSGKARAQLYLPGGSMAQTLLADLSLFYLSVPTVANGNETIDVFYPSSLNSSTEGSVTWATAWPSSVQGSSVAFTGAGPPVNSWVNWTLLKTQTILTSGLILGLHDENITTPVWRYFSSKDNANGPGATYPITDSQPRVWLFDQTGSSSW